MAAPGSRDWDAATYARGSDIQAEWAENVLARLPLRGDETVLDAGCGTGQVTLRLLDRLPRGRVIAVDSSEEMVRHARRLLGERATVVRADLTALTVDEPVDAVFSNAVFHWVLDQQRLFERLHAALRPGGALVAQCGGTGNLERFLATVDAVAADERFEPHLRALERPWAFRGPRETEERLRAAGFGSARAWLEPSHVVPGDAETTLRAAPLRCHLALLPQALHQPFVDEVLRRCGTPLRLDYQRLNIDARR